MNREYDVVILGSGFSGSLLGLILTKQGLSVLIIDRQRHPRFAIGESSTPAADFILESLCEQYGLHEIRPICRYGSWKRTVPEIACGLKRGFSYFHHRGGEFFTTGPHHDRELLVAASVDDEVADTHWYRADVDEFFARQFIAAGGTLWEDSTAAIEQVGEQWRVDVRRGVEDQAHPSVSCEFLVDATGGDSALIRVLKLPSSVHELSTRTRSLFGHFRDVRLWGDHLDRCQISQDDHPYPCDLAALHHVIPGGWMWMLRFDQGITSVGWSLDMASHPLEASRPPLEEWNQLRSQYPSIGEQLSVAEPVEPFSMAEPLRRTGRLQRLVTPAAAVNWALMPHTAGFIDPFFSTGIAQSLLGVERLAAILAGRVHRQGREEELARYSRTLEQELRLIDRMVSLSIRTMGGDPRLLHAATMIYFAAATTFEQQRLAGHRGAFLLADEVDFVEAVHELSRVFPGKDAAEREVDGWVRQVESQIHPWNSVGLFRPQRPGMYSRTSTK